MTNHSLLRVTATALFLVAACKSDFPAGSYDDGGPPMGSSLVSCDPFQPTTKPIALTTVLGAGRDTDGTLYVVDQPQFGSERVFVSSAGTLQRQRSGGASTESSGNGVISYTFSISDHVPPFMLKLETNAAGPTAMGVLQGTTDVKTFTIGQEGSVLTLVPTSQIAGVPVANIPAQTFIEYNATLSDGRALLVVRPLDDWTYQDFRVFFGAADRMIERTVGQVTRLRDGGSTTINFTIDGVAAVASFSVSLSGVAPPPTLTIGTTQFPLTLGPTNSPPAGYNYSCFGNPSFDGGAVDGPPSADGASTGPTNPDGGNDTVPTLQGILVPTGSMTTARQNHTATLLGNGKVLIVGGAYNGCLASAELYDPAAGTFTATGSMTTARSQHTATLLPNGKVLIAGGYDCSGPSLASAELYDPATGTFMPTGGMTTARKKHTATLLGNGKVLIAGGFDRIISFAVAELYDPVAGTFTTTGNMTTGRYDHTATLLPSGKVLIAGGFLLDRAPVSAEQYDPEAEAFTATGNMTTERDLPTATLLPSGKVLITGGWQYDTNLPLSSAEWYDPDLGLFVATGTMALARSGHTATLLSSGKVLIAGGDDGHLIFASPDLFDPAAGTFKATGSTTVARQSHTATLLPNGRVLLAGGWDGVVSVLASAELYE